MIAARFKTRKFWVRLFYEFWIAILAATIWTFFYGYSHSTTFGLSDCIAQFSASFFLAAWFTGQFVRVDRQQSVDENLKIIREETAAYKEAMTKVTELLVQVLQRATTDPAAAKTIADIVKLMAEANAHFVTANNAVVMALTAMNLTTGPPELGRPALNITKPTE